MIKLSECPVCFEPASNEEYFVNIYKGVRHAVREYYERKGVIELTFNKGEKKGETVAICCRCHMKLMNFFDVGIIKNAVPHNTTYDEWKLVYAEEL